jgi:EmrB/QacA subfamily drug resistance transporter
LTRQEKSAIAVLLAGAFLAVLNHTLINPAMPSVMAEFGVSATTVQFLASGYTLVNAIVIAVTAFLMDKFSTRKLFLDIFVLFLIGSLLAAWGPHFGVLLAGRMLQAVCAGVIMPMSMTILMLIYPLEKRGSAMGLYSLVMMSAPAIGPVISGLSIDKIGWHVMFLMVAVLAGLILVFASIGLKNYGEIKPVTLDKPSLMLSSAGLFALLYGFASVGSSAVFPVPLLSIAVGAVLLTVFSMRQLKMDKPFLQIRVLANRQFRLGISVIMLVTAIMSAEVVGLPLYIQSVRGMPAVMSGLVMMPGSILGAIASFLTGKVYDRFGARYPAIAGVSLVTVGAFGMTMLGSDTPVFLIILPYSMLMIGLTVAIMPMNIWSVAKLPKDILHHGNAVNSTFRQIAATLGVAIMVSVMSFAAALAAQGGDAQAELTGIRIAFWVAVAFGVMNFVIVIFNVKRRPD